MKVVDSCGWIEYFADGPNADFFATPIEEMGDLVVPTITLAEVYRHFCVKRTESDAFEAIAAMHQGLIVELDPLTAHAAARLSLEHRLPLVDAVILASARVHESTLWTQDAHFEGIEGVRYQPMQ